jgi:hypothetical protein
MEGGNLMGLVASWIAVKTEDAGPVLAELGLVETGEYDLGDLVLDSFAVLPGWTVVFVPDFNFAAPETMRRLSARHDAVGCQASESAMHSAAFGYSAGEQVWAVEHDPEMAGPGLKTHGRLPIEFETERDEALRRQAEAEDGDVDDIFDVPLALTAALCGYRPDQDTAPADVVFRFVEPIRTGKAGKRQAAARALRDRLAARVRDELFPAAQRLGFEALIGHPAFHQFYPRRVTNTFVRFRGDQSDCLEFQWGLPGGVPQIGLNFFVRKGAEPCYGRAGHASAPIKPLTLLERFTGRKQDPEAAIGKAIADALQMLDAVDRHLRDGTTDPNLRPADYHDQRSGG